MIPEIQPAKLALAVDTVVFGYQNGELYLLLIERGIEPFRGQWALPGGFVREDETLDAAALRELKEETGVEIVYLEQLYTYGELKRDPRYRVVSVAYFALVRVEGYKVEAGTDAKNARWFPVSALPALAFDHSEIIERALGRVRTKIQYEPLAFELLPIEFTLFQLQQLFEAILGRELDKRNFRKKILSYRFLKEGRKLRDVKFRSPALYRFESVKYERMRKRGESFSL
jgi:8-oxo-dGTP diphosphatase